MRRRILHGLYEACAGFIIGTTSAILADGALTGIDLGLAHAAAIGGIVGGLEVVEDVARDVRDHYRDQRKAGR